MVRKINQKRNRQFIFLAVGFFLVQALILAFTLQPTIIKTIDNQNDSIDEDLGEFDNEVEISAGILPNITRAEAPVILDNESTSGMFDGNGLLNGLHVDNIRILYYSLENEWIQIPFQLDEKAYFRSYTTGLGLQAQLASTSSLEDLDLSNGIYYDYRHTYVGGHIDTQIGGAYEEPGEWATMNQVYDARSSENYVDNGAVMADLTQPMEAPLTTYPGGLTELGENVGGVREQLARRIDWDDELVFYIYNGQQASPYSWWNHENFQERLAITVNDPVDGGQSWMYIYYNDTTPDPLDPPDINYYIPTSGPHAGEDHVSWDKINKKITADTYEMQLDTDNTDLQESTRIKWPGMVPNDLYDSSDKQYMSLNFRIYAHIEESVVDITVDETGDTEVWREGDWMPDGVYNEQINAIGYGLEVDFDMPGMPGWVPGQDGSYTDAHRDNADVSGVSEEHVYQDEGNYFCAIFTIGAQVTNNDAADHDTQITTEPNGAIPYLRGEPDWGTEDNESAIDGPVRTIIQKTSLQGVFADLGAGPIGYEELWSFLYTDMKFYGNMYQTDPTALDLGEFDTDDFRIYLDVYYAYMLGREFSSFVQNDGATIWAGLPPDSNYPEIMDPNSKYGPATAYIPTKNNRYGQQWSAQNPLYLSPNEDDTDDDFSGCDGPNEGVYNDPMAPVTRNDNPLPNWIYLQTSSGGIWQNIPYREVHQCFNESNDLRTYWRDDSSKSEMALYGYDSTTNGATMDYSIRNVFGNLTYWECLREFGRQQYQLNDNLGIVQESFLGGPVFEDSAIYINGIEVIGSAYVSNGDVIWIDCDMQASFPAGWSITTTLGYSGLSFSEIDTDLHVHRVEFTVNDGGNQVPPSAGINIRITVLASYKDEEVYLDNTPPTPGAFDAYQTSPNDASVDVTWSGWTDNGNPDLIDYYEVWRDDVRVQTIDAPSSFWLDTSVVNGGSYDYYLKVFDMAGQSTSTAIDTVSISLAFDPCQPDPLPTYFTSTVTLDWTSNPGDTGTITNYRTHWSKTSGGPYTPTTWHGPSARTYEFTPSAGAGAYYFVIECDSAGGPVFSAQMSSIYDNEMPIPSTINGIPDQYYPTVAEIPVQWNNAFDGISGVDYYILERAVDITGTGGSWGAYSRIPDGSTTFNPGSQSYTDVYLDDNYGYKYQVGVYDIAGNGPVYSSEEIVFYHDDNVLGNDNLILTDVVASASQADISETFNVVVTVVNTGGGPGDISDVNLKFLRGGTQDVTAQYVIPESVPSFLNGLAGSGASQDFTFTGVYADTGALEGQMTIQAEMVGTTSDDAASNPDTIMIRKHENLAITAMYADSPVNLDSSGNIIQFNVSNIMTSTQIEIINYSIDLQEWTALDYSLLWPPSMVGEILDPGEEIQLVFEMSVDAAADPTGVITVDFQVGGEEVGSAIDCSNTTTAGTTFTCLGGDSDPPVVTPIAVAPDPWDPETSTQITISATITDASPISIAEAYIQIPDGNTVETVTLVDQGGNLYSGIWNCSGYAEGTYYVDYYAEDAATNPRSVNNGDTFTLDDDTNPTITGASFLNDPQEYGGIQTVYATVSDYSGIQWVRAYIEQGATPITNFLLYNDGPGGGHGDADASDDIFTNEWDTGSPLRPEALYNLDIVARDNILENHESTSNDLDTCNIVDSVGPSIVGAIITPDSGNIGQVFTITATVTDLSGVNAVSAWIQQPDGVNIDYVSMLNTVGDIYEGTWDSTGQSEGTYFVDVEAEDSNNNNATANNIDNDITLGDSVAPTISNVNFNPAVPDPEAGGTMEITCNVTDAETGVGVVMFHIQMPDGNDVYAAAMTHYGGTGYRGTWVYTSESIGSYFLDINATDNSLANNSNYADNAATFDLEDHTDPTITNEILNDDPTLELGDIQTIRCNVTDFSGVGSVTAFIINASTQGVVATRPMSNPGGWGTGYVATWDSTGNALGNYEVDLRAVDSSPAGNQRDIDNALNFALEDTTGPSFSGEDLNPNPAGLDSLITITCDVTDLSGLYGIYAIVQNTAETIDLANLSMSNVGGNTYQVQWDSTGQPEANYHVDIEAWDNEGNQATFNNIEDPLFIGDITPPDVQNVDASPAVGDPEAGGTLTITCNITDGTGIASVEAYIQIPDGNTVATVIMSNPGGWGTGWVGTWVYTSQTAGSYFVDVNATDSSIAANERIVDNGDTFDLVDSTLPVIEGMTVSDDPLELGNIQDINCTATDFSGIAEVRAFVQHPDGTNIANLLMTDWGSNNYGVTWDSSLAALGDYYVDFRATDGSAGSNQRNENNGATFQLEDNTGPSISAEAIDPDAGDLDVSYDISCDVTDLSGVANVYAIIQNVSETEDYENITLVNTGGDTWEGTWDSTGYLDGTYHVDIEAWDNQGNSATSDNIDADITITDGTAPTISNEAINPNAGPVNTQFNISCDVIDGTGILEVWATIQNGTWQDAVELVSVGGNTYAAEWDSTGWFVGNYTVDINATDSSPSVNVQYSNDIGNITLEAGDNTPPSITNVLALPDPANEGDTVDITATISDVSGIHTPNVTIVGIGTYDMVNIGGNNWRYQWDTSGVGDATYQIDINATDMSINENNNYLASAEDVTVSDAPVVSNILVSDDPLELGSTQTITCVVHDNDGVTSVTATVQISGAPDVDVVILPMANVGGDNYQVTWNSTGNAVENYVIDIDATDGSNPVTVDDGASFTLQDSQAPTTSNADINPNIGEPNANFDISVDVIDFSQVQAVYAIVQDSTQTVTIQNITLTNIGITYSGTWDSTGNPEGTYYVDIEVWDNVTNSNTVNNIDGSITISDTQAPNIVSVQAVPATGDPEAGTIITITAGVIDPSGLASVVANIQHPDGVSIANVTLNPIGGNLYENTWDTTGRAVGTYYVDIKAIDGSLNSNEANQDNGDTFDLVDNTNPTVTNIGTDVIGNCELGDIVTISCDAADFSGITSVTAYVQDPDGANIAVVVMSNVGGDTYQGTWNSTGANETTHYIDINVVDGSAGSNSNYTNNGATFDVEDTTAPTVNYAVVDLASADPELGEIITITSEISDLSGITSVEAYLQMPDGTTLYTLTLYDDGSNGDVTPGDGIYTNTWNCSGAAEGTYYLDLNATDGSSNSNVRTINNGDTFDVEDLTLPVISGVVLSDDPTLELGDIQTITCTVTDASGLSSVTAFVQISGTPDVTVATLPMANIGGDTYQVTWDSTGDTLGAYVIDIRARDAANNNNERYSDDAASFTLQDTTAPTVISTTFEDRNGGDPEPGDVFDIRVNVTDLSTIQSVIAIVTDASETTTIATITLWDDGAHNDYLPGDGVYGNEWNSTGQPEGGYPIDINATDNQLNSLFVDNGTIIILGDKTPPTIVGVVASPDPADPEAGDIVTINATVTDNVPYNIGSVTAYVKNSSGVTIAILPMNNITSLTLYQCTWDTTDLPTGDYDIDIVAIDSSLFPNTNNLSNAGSVTLDDQTAPQITNPNANPSTLELGGDLIITCDVSDLSGISSVIAIILLSPNVPVAMFDDGLGDDATAGDGTYTATWNSALAGGQEGTITINITATDNSPNFNSQLLGNADTFDLQDTSDPTITNINAVPYDNVEIGPDNVTISVDVSDPSGIQDVWATIRFGGSWVAGIQLPNIGGNTYSVQWNATGLTAGNYTLEINATDNAIANNQDSQPWGTEIRLINPIPDVGLEILLEGYKTVLLSGFDISEGGYYIQSDSITFYFGIGVNKTDIIITNIYIDDFSILATPYNSNFTFSSVNWSLPLQINDSAGFTYIEVVYSINPGVLPIDDIDVGNLVIEYNDTANYKYPDIVEATYCQIDLFDEAAFDGVWIAENGQALSGTDPVTFRANGTWDGDDNYNAYLNLTNYGMGILAMGRASNNYSLTFPNMPTGVYDGALISVILNTSIDGITSNMTVTQNFAGQGFTVDATAPVINSSSFLITLLSDGWVTKANLTDLDPDAMATFYIWVNITDNQVADTGVLTAGISVGGVIFIFTNDTGYGEDVWRATISTATIRTANPDLFDVTKNTNRIIDIGLLTALDNAANPSFYDASGHALNLIDVTPPALDFETFDLGDDELAVDGTFTLPANDYVSLRIKASDVGGGAGLLYLRVYFSVSGGSGIQPSAEDELGTYITLNKLGDEYYGILSIEGQVGFKSGQVVTLFFVASDYEQNIYNSKDHGITYQLTFEEDSPLLSLTVLGIAAFSALGAVIFRFTFYRKRAKIIDLDSKLIKQKKKKHAKIL